MSTREFIMDAVRHGQPASRPLPVIPRFEPARLDLLVAFSEALARMGGQVVMPEDGVSVDQWMTRQFPQANVVCSATPEVQGTRDILKVLQPADLHDVDVGVARARFGVAETGSVFLGEAELHINALAFLAQHLVVLLDPASLLPTLHEAYAQPCFREARYGVLLSGPSATADIEGVLVRGAQGIRSLTVFVMSA